MKGLRAIGAGALLTVIVLGAPCALLVIGNPLTSWRDLQVGDLSATVYIHLLALVAWLAWARFSIAVLAEAWLMIEQAPESHDPVPRGMRRWTRSLLAALLIGLPVAAPPSAFADAAATAPVTPAIAPRSLPVVETVVIVRDGPRTLWALAEDRLGSGQRWREIWALNEGRRQADGTVMTDPNLLRPAWRVRVPMPGSEATSSSYVVAAGDTMSRIADVELGDGARWPEICQLNRHPHRENRSPGVRDCDLLRPGLILRLPRDEHPGTGGQATLAPSRPIKVPTADPHPAIVAPSLGDRPTPTTVPSPADQNDRLDDVVSGSLAVIVATALAVGAGRRVRQRGRRRQPHKVVQAEFVSADANIDENFLLTPGGVGISGSGADHAARAALTAVLTFNPATQADPPGEVVIDRATMTRLFGNSMVPIRPGLYVPDDLEGALIRVEGRLLYRTRLVQEGSLSEPTDSETAAAGPAPILLVSTSPPEQYQSLVKNLLNLGKDLGVRGLFLGTWNHGVTVHIDGDGRSQPVDGASTTDRVNLLDRDNAVRQLAISPEAETAGSSTPDMQPAPYETAMASDRAAALARPQLRVLGSPRVENISRAGRPLRAKAAELATFLACHPDGADTRTIGDHLEPDVRLHNADVHVHTNVSNLRHVLGRAAAPRRIGYVIKSHGRYRIDREAVDVDLWELTDLLARAATAPRPERIQLLRRACDVYAAPLADGCLYEWIEPYRERARRQAVDAHVRLAEDLCETDSRAASDVLDRAIRHDPYNENLYVGAMQVRRRIGDADGVRTLLRALTTSLSELDLEPRPETIELALRSSEADTSGT